MKLRLVETSFPLPLFALIFLLAGTRDGATNHLDNFKPEDHTEKLADYELVKELGRGNNAVVMLAKPRGSNGGEEVAIKFVNKVEFAKKFDLKHLENEKRIMGQVHDCENIVRLHRVIEPSNWEWCYLVMEYVKGETLFFILFGEWRKPAWLKHEKREDWARPIFRQIASAIAHVHGKGFAHRDLKPENILLSDKGVVKLTDFGLSTDSRDGDPPLTTYSGTPRMMAPEILLQQAYDGRKADVWSAGVILWTLVAGEFPFGDSNDIAEVLETMFESGTLVFPFRTTDGFLELVALMLNTDASQRKTMREIQKDSWLNDHHHEHYSPSKKEHEATGQHNNKVKEN